MNFSYEIEEYPKHSIGSPILSKAMLHKREHLIDAVTRNIQRMKIFGNDFHIKMKEGNEVIQTFQSENFKNRKKQLINQ